MDQIIRTPRWVRGGRIEEIVWIGKDVLAWCIGLYIVFFHVVKRRQTLRWCWCHATGDGARCMAGHASSPILAFSERSLDPRILVLAYPSMTRICECVQGCHSGYLAIAFTPHDHLVSLGSHPNFPMIVWCWRTGERITIVDTSMRDEVGQIIRITPSGRTVIGQMGKTCGRLFTWELDVVGKIVILKDHEVKLPKEATIHDFDWCPVNNDPLLAVTDRDGHIYLSNYDGTEIRRIVLSQRCGICLEIEMPAVCWFRGGIILRTTFCQIRYYKKDPKTDAWRKQWYIKSLYKPYLLIGHPLRNDWFFYYTLEGYLMQMSFPENDGTPSIYRHLHHGDRYRFVDFLYPWCHHLAATDDLKELAILESCSGNEISKVQLDMEGAISAQASHPNDPLIVVISDRGEMMILGVADPELPAILARFHLQRRPLDLVRFSRSGKYLIAAQKETGNCYCINLRRDKPWSVIAKLRTRRQLADVVLYDDDDDDDDDARESLRVHALYIEYERFAVGQRFLVYRVSLRDGTIDEGDVDTNVVALSGLFRELCHAPDNGGRQRLLVGSPYLERQLHVLELREFKDATLMDAALTGHHARLARVFADRRWIVTCAYDGLIVVRDGTVRRVLTVVPAHHRLDSGTAKAIVSPDGDAVIALGYDGSLVAVQIRRASEQESEQAFAPETEDNYPMEHECYEKRKERIHADYASLDPAIRASLTRARQESLGSESKTWEEWRRDAWLQNEARLCAAERNAITADLAALKVTVRQLLDANEICPEIERLPVSAFDLDKAARDQKLKVAKDEREDVRMELEYLCYSMDRVSGWIKATFWEPQLVLGRSIFSFRGDTEVTNYPLLEDDPEVRDHLRWAQFVRDAERGIIDGDTLQPWRKYTDDRLRAEPGRPIRVYREDEPRGMDVLLEEEEREIDPAELAELRALDGMTTHRFVEQSPYYYSQMESYGFAHVTLDDRYLTHDYGKLRGYFNKLFDDMYATKEREMGAIRERNERIRHIDSELWSMFRENVPRIPIDPLWHPKEEVESIVRVLDREVKAKPYLSPSQLSILNRQAAEAERVRQLLLADDFRERALTRMMDGVLEIRWEDTIKVDVREPACLLEKQPERYTPDDIAAVKRYEADVEFLRQERERYRRMLETDYAKISAQLQEVMDKFDAKLNDFFQRLSEILRNATSSALQLKLEVEAAIGQLKLRHLRGRMRNLARIEGLREDDRMKREISDKRQYQAVLEEHVRNFHDVYRDMLAQHDAFSARERAMAKRPQQEFVSLSKANIEYLERQYRRRPKVSLKNVAAGDLINLAHHLTGHFKLVYLPDECTDYSRTLESLDARPDGLPKSIDASHWDHLIRARRQKIEMELRIRAWQQEMTEVERTIATFEGKIDICRSSVNLLAEGLKKARDERVTREQDAELQLVLKMGQVEIELGGERRDTIDAILVPRAEIERVNEHILAVGERKLNALRRTSDFRHGISSIEWEHRCLRTRFRELEEDLRFLKDVVVTRDMRAYLKRKAKGLRDDKTAVRLDRQIGTARRSLERTLSKETSKLDGIRGRIVTMRRRNSELDRAITEMNVARWKMEYERDLTHETRQRGHMDRKMRLFRQRSELIGKLQDNYAELLALQTEHELLRLRTYPTLEYFETLDDQGKVY